VAKIPRTSAGTRAAPVVPMVSERPATSPATATVAGEEKRYDERDVSTQAETVEQREAEEKKAEELTAARKLIAHAAGPLNELLVAVGVALTSEKDADKTTLSYAKALRKLAHALREKPSE